MARHSAPVAVAKTGPSSIAARGLTWLDDNKINCHAIVQPIFMKFTDIVGYGNPRNIIEFE